MLFVGDIADVKRRARDFAAFIEEFVACGGFNAFVDAWIDDIKAEDCQPYVRLHAFWDYGMHAFWDYGEKKKNEMHAFWDYGMHAF